VVQHVLGAGCATRDIGRNFLKSLPAKENAGFPQNLWKSMWKKWDQAPQCGVKVTPPLNWRKNHHITKLL
jgi:hypothetical protein